MPLRKIPDAGRKTIQLLEPALERYHGRSASKSSSFWTCRDLVALPKNDIQRCLQRGGRPSTLEENNQWDILLQRCQGIDNSIIIDDQGGMPKTISVENSFRRGTVLSPEAVWKGLEDLYVRLPRLLLDRKEWSRRPELAYPTTLRLTARTVDGSLVALSSKQRRRPFVTKSKQVPFSDGSALLQSNISAEQQQTIIKKAVAPLVHSLVLCHGKDLNVTRLNIAVTNFKDIPERTMFSPSATSASTATSMFNNFQFNKSTPKRDAPSSIKETFFNRQKKHKNCPQSPFASQPSEDSQSLVSKAAVKSEHKALPDAQDDTASNKIDPLVLAELPPDIVKEIVRDYNQVVQSQTKNLGKEKRQLNLNKNKPARIDQFFSRK